MKKCNFTSNVKKNVDTTFYMMKVMYMMNMIFLVSEFSRSTKVGEVV